MIDYPDEQIHESGSNEAGTRIRTAISDALYKAENYDQASEMHHVPCYGCGRKVHGEYCFSFLLGFVMCDPCSNSLSDTIRMKK